MRRIDARERRVRLARRHHLAGRAADVDAAAAAVVGLHSSDPATVFLSAAARVHGFAVGDLEAALYDRRSLVRMLGMRRTMFVVPIGTAAVMDAACTRALARGERRRLIAMLEAQQIASDGAAWVDRVERRTLDALSTRGEATAVELTADVPELSRKIRFGEGKRWGGTVGVSTRILFLLATDGRIVRGRPLGTWLSSQYRWARTEAWLDGGLAAIDPPAARADLIRRWLGAYGPGTLTDVRWWTGWGVRDATAALAEVGATEVEVDEGIGFVLPDDLDPEPATEPWAALLPALDSTVMGWKERNWYLGEHGPRLFDRNGNAGPTVWWNGRVVGGWGQDAGGDVVVKLLETVDGAAGAKIAAEADRLTSWLRGMRVKPRFRTPLESEITGQAARAGGGDTSLPCRPDGGRRR